MYSRHEGKGGGGHSLSKTSTTKSHGAILYIRPLSLKGTEKSADLSV